MEPSISNQAHSPALASAASLGQLALFPSLDPSAAAQADWAPIDLAWPVVHPGRGVPFACRAREQRPALATTPEVDHMLQAHAVVAIGVSGGKDSDAVALAVARHLDRIGHQGPRVLIHSDLGRVEWEQSLPHCEQLAATLGWELMVVRRSAGDLMQRWESRWAANLQRYQDLSCVTLILPWSTPALRFCTGELKAQVICSELRKRWPTQPILNVTGIRRQESASRSRMPISSEMTQLLRKRHGATGRSWNAIIEWDVQDVFGEIFDSGLGLREAYTRYGASRVSCTYCIMSTARDLLAGTRCADNIETLRAMVSLELSSTFGFQGSRWLADVAPEHLTWAQRAAIPLAKAAAQQRVAAEREIPKHLLFSPGYPAFPTAVPSLEDAALLAGVRHRVAKAVGFYGSMRYTSAVAIRERYAELLALKAAKAAKATKSLPDDTEAFAAVDEADPASATCGAF